MSDLSSVGSDRSQRDCHACSTSLVATVVFVSFLYVAWIGAWLLERWLERRVGCLGTIGERSAYWLAMKLLIWILPAVMIMRLSGRSFWSVMRFDRLRSIVVWGGGIGLILGSLTIAAKLLGHQPLLASHWGWSFFSGVFVSPIVEEITFRGAILGALNQRFRFATANLITGALFLGIHLPGWFFQGCLATNLKTPVGGAFSIFLLGLVFGYVAHKSKSVAASTLTHILNNFFNA